MVLEWHWATSIDVSDENHRIVSESLRGNSNIQNDDDEPELKKTREGNTEDDETKWCFYVRGVNTTVRIEDEDLTEKEYEELRNSYADRLKVMNDKKAELGPCADDEW